MASISFTDDAGESFANFLQHIDGYTVEVTDTRGAKFDATVLGSAAEELDDYFAVRLQQLKGDNEPYGPPLAVVVRDLKVY